MTRATSAFIIAIGAASMTMCAAAPIAAQEAPASQGAKPRLTPLKIQLVVSRYQGEKKIASLPYVLWVTANDHSTTNLRMGIEVPVSTTSTPGSVVPAPTSFSYRSVGTSIDCSASSTDNGFDVNITLSDSSIQFDPKQGSTANTGLANAPAFRSFMSKFSILLRDGQTAQYTSATDPVSGEVLKVDVTLNVLK